MWTAAVVGDGVDRTSDSKKGALVRKTKVTLSRPNLFQTLKRRYLENDASYSYVVYVKRTVFKKPFFWRQLDVSSFIGS